MNTILSIDMKDYDISQETIFREAAKAFVIIGDKLLFLKSSKEDLLLIGGGIEGSESPLECLIREIKKKQEIVYLMIL